MKANEAGVYHQGRNWSVDISHRHLFKKSGAKIRKPEGCSLLPALDKDPTVRSQSQSAVDP